MSDPVDLRNDSDLKWDSEHQDDEFLVETVENCDWNVKRESLLGEEDAEDEWKDESTAIPIFWHTPSYNVLTHEDTLYMFGLRGTGKTAMIKMLRHEMQNNKDFGYAYVWSIGQREIIDFINNAYSIYKTQFMEMPLINLVDHFRRDWIKFFSINAMMEILTNEYDKDKKNNDICAMYEYVKTLGISFGNDNQSFQKMEVDKSALLEMILGISNETESSLNYDLAKDSLTDFLKSRGTCLILIDTMEYYDLNDKITRYVTTALIEAVKELYTERRRDRILVKVAFPLEIYSHLKEMNPGKTSGYMMFIRWRYRDLVILLAKRYYWFIIGRQENSSVKLRTLKDLEIFKNAQEFLYQHFPEYVTSKCSNKEFDTLAYAIRHT